MNFFVKMLEIGESFFARIYCELRRGGIMDLKGNKIIRKIEGGLSVGEGAVYNTCQAKPPPQHLKNPLQSPLEKS